MMLEAIIAAARNRVELLPRLEELQARAGDAPMSRSFGAALKGERLGVIAEIKRRSPSRGELAPELVPSDMARRYAAGGASCISVLTEPSFFGGADTDLEQVRQAVSLPIIRKDFTVDPRQIWEARVIGADAVLLIVAALTRAELQRLQETALEAGLEALVEVHDEAEAEVALSVGADLIGVNNRNLNTFEVDLATAERLGPSLAGVAVTVGESGISTAADAWRMKAAGYDAILVGETLVRSAAPEDAIAGLRV